MSNEPAYESRPLNLLEQNLLLLDQASNFSFIVVAGGTGDLDAGLLRQALTFVQRQHFYLNVSLDLSRTPVFVPHAELPIPLRVVEDAGETRWLAEAEVELNTKLDLLQGPFLRVVLLTRPGGWDLVATFEHLISDGVSGVHFVREVMEAYGQLAQGVTPEAPPVRDRLFPDASVFPRSVFGIRGAFKFLAFMADLAFNSVRFGKAHFPPAEWVPLDRRDVRLAHHALTQEETERLVERCRDAQTTVQGALAAALLLTLAGEIRERAGIPEPVIENLSSVNARPYCLGDLQDRQMGIWVGQVSRPHALRPGDDFWDLARSAIRELHQVLASDVMFVPYRLMFRKAYSDPVAFTKLFENARPYVEVTNVGRLAFATAYGPLTLERLHVASGLQFTQGTPWALTLGVATFDGRLQAIFHYLADYWDAATAERVSAAVVERLLRA